MPGYIPSTNRPDLQGCMKEALLDSGKYIGTRILTPIETIRQVGTFPKIEREQLLKNAKTARAKKSAYNRSDWTFTDHSFKCQENGIEEPVDDSENDFATTYFDAELVSSQIASDVILRNQEVRIAALVFDTNTFTPTPVTNEWDDANNSTPIKDINTGKQAIRDATGLIANTLVIAYATYLDLSESKDIIDRIKYSNPEFARTAGQVTPQLLAQVFGLADVLVGSATTNTANEGQSVVLGDIWNREYAMLCCVAKDNVVEEPCIGRTFAAKNDGGLLTIETYREEQVRGDVVRARQSTDEQIILPEAGYLLSNITTGE